MSTMEKWVVGVLGIVALIMFFFPLSTAKAPIFGARSFTGYDVVRNKEATNSLTDGMSSDETPFGEKSSASEASDIDFPISIKYIFLIRIWIAISFVGALLCIVGIIVSRRLAAIGSALGVASAILAIVHFKIVNSDFHRMFEDMFSELRDAQGDNLFSNLAEGLASGMNISPGFGLYVMAVCLGVATILINSRLLRRVRLVEVSEN